MTQNDHIRTHGRSSQQLRPISFSNNTFGYADSSVLFEMGNTKILCSITLQQGVPHFLKGTKTGWLTAEYALLPTATAQRVQRESQGQKLNGRSVEIARLIGRSLRSIIDFAALGEQTILVDCDVLQADGGTRTAAITGAALALKYAQHKWLTHGKVHRPFLTDEIAAISVGLSKGEPLLDIDYQEDMSIDADYNFVLTKSGSIVEIQGTAEKKQVSWESFNQLCITARRGIEQLFAIIDSQLHKEQKQVSYTEHTTDKTPFFSLKNRFNTSRP